MVTFHTYITGNKMDLKIKKSKKDKSKPPIRFGIGIMRGKAAISHKNLHNGLKNDEGIIIIHRDDFDKIIENTVGFGDFKNDYYDLTFLMDSWEK